MESIFGASAKLEEIMFIGLENIPNERYVEKWLFGNDLRNKMHK